MIQTISPRHYKPILRLNTEFVYWLSPLDEAGLDDLLSKATYARQINEAAAVLIGYPHDTDWPDHKNLDWLRQRLGNFFYIDRIIVDEAAQGQALGQRLYADIASYAKDAGYDHLACEVNTKPDNPISHAFHLAQGFQPLGDQVFPGLDKALRYYAKAL